MAQSTQIVPEWSFPYVQTVINNYTGIEDAPAPAAVDNSIKLIFPVVSAKGEDGTWIRFSSKKAATEVLGDSNFKTYGQPLMEALNVLDEGNANVWIMRVMPENATYSNAIVSCYYKADENTVEASDRKFRIKLTSKSFEDVKTAKELLSKLKESDGVITPGNNAYKDGEGYTQAPILAVRYAGHGTCGDNFSLRISSIPSYEKEYGIKLYDFQAINSDNGLTNASEVIGSLVTSAKYGSETATLINDLIEDADAGVVPVNVYSDEDRIEVVYDAYIEFAEKLHTDLEAEYEAKVAEYNIPADMMSGKIPVTPEYLEKYNKLIEISNMIDATDVNELPDLDEFDILFGNKVGSTDVLPGIYYVEELTDSVDISAPEYKAENYTSSKVVNFTSDKGLLLENGGNGYFDEPRKVTTTEGVKQWTLQDEIDECYKNAWSGVYDKRILSSRRLQIDAIFDAGYSFDVKQTMYELALARNSARVYLDAGIIESFNQSTLYALRHTYSVFSDRLCSVDTQNYWVKEYSTNKKCNVTISYFLARNFVSHLSRYSSVIPMVNEKCQLSGHIKDSLAPIVEEYDKTVMESLNNNRFNYFVCVDENVYQRGTQNTRDTEESDLIEESNILVLYKLKAMIEKDLIGKTYAFTDEIVRTAFVNEEKSRFANWVGTMLESFDISFAANEYEYKHSIVHCYVSIVFRGLTKRFIVEIDINPRDYSSLAISSGN